MARSVTGTSNNRTSSKGADARSKMPLFIVVFAAGAVVSVILSIRMLSCGASQWLNVRSNS